MSRSTAFQFRAGNSFFHRLDPLTKLAWVFGISLLAFGAYIAWVQIIIASGVMLTALFLARLSVTDIFRGTWLFGLACISFWIIQTLTLPGKHVAFHILGHRIYAESADYALASALRIYTIVLGSLVFVRTADPRELAIALVTQMRVPYRIAYAFFIALRIVPTIEGRDQDDPCRPTRAGCRRQARHRRPYLRVQALRHAAARRQPAPRLDDGDVDGNARLRRLPYANVCRCAENGGIRHLGLLHHDRSGRRVVHRPCHGLCPHRLCLLVLVRATRVDSGLSSRRPRTRCAGLPAAAPYRGPGAAAGGCTSQARA